MVCGAAGWESVAQSKTLHVKRAQRPSAQLASQTSSPEIIKVLFKMKTWSQTEEALQALRQRTDKKYIKSVYLVRNNGLKCRPATTSEVLQNSSYALILQHKLKQLLSLPPFLFPSSFLYSSSFINVGSVT